MKAKSLYLLLVLSSQLMALNALAENKNWTEDQANLLPQGRWETGLFSQLRYGVTDNIELQTHPLAFFMIPNLAAKIALPVQGNWNIASKHSLHVPTYLLRAISNEGTGGVLPLNSEIPFMVSMGTGLVATTQIGLSSHSLSIETGFVVTPKFGNSNFPELELPLLYLRTASYHDTISVKGSIALQGRLWNDFHYSIQQQAMIAPNYNGAFSLEQTAKIMWRLHENFELMLGVDGVITRYPRQTRLNIFPLFDARFGF